MSEAFDYLDAPVLNCTGKDVPMPYAENLEKLALTSVEEVVEKAKQITYRQQLMPKILMPALSPTMESGTLAKWIVNEGDKMFRVTAVNFIKDGQTWRLTTHRTPLES